MQDILKQKYLYKNPTSLSSDSTNWKLHEMLNSITDMLCNWIPVVKEVIELTSEEILLKVQQGPATEIQFWNERKINLEFILKQVFNIY